MRKVLKTSFALKEKRSRYEPVVIGADELVSTGTEEKTEDVART